MVRRWRVATRRQLSCRRRLVHAPRLVLPLSMWPRMPTFTLRTRSSPPISPIVRLHAVRVRKEERLLPPTTQRLDSVVCVRRGTQRLTGCILLVRVGLSGCVD